jgi:hypothetical protein
MQRLQPIQGVADQCAIDQFPVRLVGPGRVAARVPGFVTVRGHDVSVAFTAN